MGNPDSRLCTIHHNEHKGKTQIAVSPNSNLVEVRKNPFIRKIVFFSEKVTNARFEKCHNQSNF